MNKINEKNFNEKNNQKIADHKQKLLEKIMKNINEIKNFDEKNKEKEKSLIFLGNQLDEYEKIYQEKEKIIVDLQKISKTRKNPNLFEKIDKIETHVENFY